MIGDSGADAIELWCEPPHYDSENTLPFDIQQLADILLPYKMSVSAHAPCNDVNITTRYNDMNQGIQRIIVKLVDELDTKLEARRITFHPGQVYWKGFVKDSDFVSMAFYRSMARATPMQVNMENQAPTGHPFAYTVASTPESLDMILSNVPEIGFTLDTGHANIAKLDPLFLLNKYGPRIKEIHLSNNGGSVDSHDILSKGSLDLGPFLDAVIGRDLSLILELNPYVYTPEQVMAEYKTLVERVSVRG